MFFYQYLTIYQRCHELYREDVFVLHMEDFDKFRESLSACDEQGIFQNAISITDVSILNMDKVLGDDVAQVRSHILNNTEAEELQKQSPNYLTETQMKVSCSYISQTKTKTGSINDYSDYDNSDDDLNKADTSVEQQEKKQTMLGYINDIAESFNVTLPKKMKMTQEKKIMPKVLHGSHSNKKNLSINMVKCRSYSQVHFQRYFFLVKPTNPTLFFPMVQ